MPEGGSGVAARANVCFRRKMGDEVSSSRFTREERQRYREKVQLCLDVFEQMLGKFPVSE